ncbi:MAG: penicillin-binding protein 1A [Desulfobacteraceae bacterium]|nr:penicillin-binding protein 1A [Desulfobacteraceae bacterium]
MRRVGRFLLVFFKWGSLFVLALSIAGVLAFAGLYYYFSRDLPRITTLEDYEPPVITTFYSDDNTAIAEFYKEQRIVVPLSEMPEHLINAFVATEDARFYEHEGIDFYSIFRAFLKNLEAGTIVQGGSTITQQVAKSFFLTPQRSYRRKIREAILAYRIDKHFSKQEILYLYLNQIYLGNGAYGVEAAARNYFAKSAGELSLAESAILAGMPKAPSYYSPHRHFERAKQRQIYVLNRMVTEGFITNAQASEAMDQELEIKNRGNLFMETVPYFSAHVRNLVKKHFGEEALYTGGLKVYTTVNIDMQEAASKAVQKGLRELDKRQGYRGPVKHLDRSEIEPFSQKLHEELKENGLEQGMIIRGVVVAVDDKNGLVTVKMGKATGVIPVKNMSWARKPNPKVPYGRVKVTKPGNVLKTGDVVLVKLEGRDEEKQQWKLSLEQEPEVQAALINMEVDTGHVKSLIGGRDFEKSKFNRAVQSRRQPGSAFKPIIYAAALDKGYTPATTIADTPIVFEDTDNDFVWKPGNYDRTFHGFTLFRDGLIHSRNIVTVKILRDIGIDYVVDYARRLGIESHMDRNLSLALGSSGVSLLELSKAYGVFANQGKKMKPVFIRRIEDRNGESLYIAEPEKEQERAIEKSTAYIVTHLLQEVVREGTGWRVKALGRPVAGKTGTTNNLYDAWFMGYTPDYVTGVWVGHDQERSLGSNETGSRAASPIWRYYMGSILKGKPEKDFEVPSDVVFAKIDAETGLRPAESSDKVIYECFKEGTVPEKQTRSEDDMTEREEFFKKGIQ